MLVFLTFGTYCFYRLQRRFFNVEYHKRDFPGLYCLKKKVGKRTIFGTKPYATPLKKYQFLDFLNFFFLSPRRRIFDLEYRKRHFPGIYCLKKRLEKWSILDQNYWLTPLKKCQFLDFLKVLFL